MDKPTPPRRRWFQFGLRTMFVVVTMVAVWIGWERRIVAQRKAMREHVFAISVVRLKAEPPGSGLALAVQQLGVQRAEEVAPSASRFRPWIRQIMGDEPIEVVTPENKADFVQAQRLFPEALILFCPPNPGETE